MKLMPDVMPEMRDTAATHLLAPLPARKYDLAVPDSGDAL
jgi:hypothetical protein